MKVNFVTFFFVFFLSKPLISAEQISIKKKTKHTVYPPFQTSVIQPGDVIYNTSKKVSIPCWYWGAVKEKCEKTQSMKVKTGLKEIVTISAKTAFDLR